MKKIFFILLLLIFPTNVFSAGEIVFDVETLMIKNDELYIGGWALIAERNFSAGEKIDISNNINATIKIIAVGESNSVETIGERDSFNAGDKEFKNNANEDLLFPSRCNRKEFDDKNDNTCAETIYNDKNDILKRNPLTCTGSSGSSCLVRNTDFAYKFDLKELKEIYGNQTIKFIIRVEYYDVNLNYGNKLFTMSKKNNDKITKNFNLVVSESSINSLKNDFSIVEDTKDILIDTSSYSVLVKSVGTKFDTNTYLGRVLDSRAGFLYDESTYWKDEKYSIVGATFIKKTEIYDKNNGIYKGCHYGTSYCTGNFTYNIKHYNLKYGGISGNYATVGNIYSDGWANATWGSVTGGLELTINDVFTPGLKECDDNLELTKQNTDDCLNPSIVGICEHSISSNVSDISDSYENLTSNECKNQGYSSKMIHTKNYKFTQSININVFNSLNDLIPVYDIKTFRGGSFSIGANYVNNITKEEVTGSDNYYVEYYIKVDGRCQARYVNVDSSDETSSELIINDKYIKDNYYIDNKTSTTTSFYDSNNYNKGKNNTSGISVFDVISDSVNKVEFAFRDAYIELNSGWIYYNSCPKEASCKKISNKYFVPLNYPNNKYYYDINITFNNINKLKIMNEDIDSYDYKCSIKISDGKLDTMKYRVINLNNPFPNDGINVPSNWKNILNDNNNNFMFLFDRYNSIDREWYKANLTINNIDIIRKNNFNKLNNIYLNVGLDNENILLNDNNIFSYGGNIKKYKVGSKEVAP